MSIGLGIIENKQWPAHSVSENSETCLSMVHLG
jgi:hypothetical protein